jgi:hypothetical protein
VLFQAQGYNYVSGGSVVGYKLRNEMGMAFDGNNVYVIPTQAFDWSLTKQ